MSEKKGFMARVLPDDRDIGISCHPLGQLSTRLVMLYLIGVHQDRPAMKRRPTLAPVRDLLLCPTNAGDGITGPGVQRHDLKMKRAFLVTKQVIKNLAIGLFRFSLAAEKNRFSWRNDRFAPAHPIWGTAP